MKISKEQGNIFIYFMFYEIINNCNTRSEEEEEDLEDLGTEDSDDYDVGQRGKRRSGPIRRSTRARTTRYDREFSKFHINIVISS